MIMSIDVFFWSRGEKFFQKRTLENCPKIYSENINYGNLRRHIMMDSAEPSASAPVHFIDVKAIKMKCNL